MQSNEDSHSFWVARVCQLRQSIQDNPETDPQNVIKHFFFQAVDHEFHFELTAWKTKIKTLIKTAIDSMFENDGSVRERAARIIKQNYQPMIKYIRLADIRNRIVFEIYKTKGRTVGTYFERYSQPPGTAEQNIQYSKMAHGSALYTTATHTQILSDNIIYFQLLKRVFIIHDIIFNDTDIPDTTRLNWLTTAWQEDIKENGMGELVWSLFLDLWTVENSIS